MHVFAHMDLPMPERDGPVEVRLAQVLAGLSYALDLTEGQRPGHSVRTCLIGMRLAEALDLPPGQRSALFYALLMKDLGCSSNAARFAALFGAADQDLKAQIKTINWSRAIESYGFVLRNTAPGQGWLTRAWRLLGVLSCGEAGAREVVRTRCERGAEIAQLIGLEPDTANAIRALDEHWDGNGQPYGRREQEIPLLGRILGLAQTMEVFFSTYGVAAAYDMAAARRGTWFEPALVDVLLGIRRDAAFWRDLEAGDPMVRLRFFEPADHVRLASEADVDNIAEAFARVIDAKSPWTYRHSRGVAELATATGARLGLPAAVIRELRRAALLHDIGKLGVSNLILDKPDTLDSAEMTTMRRHPEHTTAILSRVSCFSHLAGLAGAHHERLDGRGYHQRLVGAQLPQFARVICVADMCEALRSSRPYRSGLPVDRVLSIMGREVGDAIDAECFAALRDVLLAIPVLEESEVPAARMVSALAEDYHQAA